jgi:uncharacterized protein
MAAQPYYEENYVNENTPANLYYDRKSLLLLLVKRGFHHSAKHLLLLMGVTTPERDLEGWLSPSQTIRDGRRAVLELLLDEGLHPEEVVGNETLLVVACRYGQEEVSRHLILAGAEVDRCSASMQSPIYVAAQSGHTSTLMALLEFKADPNVDHTYHRSALAAAARRGDIEIFHVLLEAGAHVNVKIIGYHGQSALQAAADQGNCGMLEDLLRLTKQPKARTIEKADINASD